MEKNIAEQIGLLRHRIISPVLMENDRSQMAYFRLMAERQFDVPSSGLHKFKASTMKSWLKKYRKFGFPGITPKTRADKGVSRKLSPETQKQITLFRQKHLELPTTLFYDKCLSEGILTNRFICYTTFIKFLKSNDLFKKRTPQPRKRYEASAFGDLWVADFCHGPQVNVGKKKRCAILLAIIDDMTRMIVGAKFSVVENTTTIEEVFKEAILVYGVVRRLYTDNGPAFSSHYLAKTCANLKISLIHSKPYDSPSRGKIERFFRTMRTRFLTTLPKEIDLAKLNDLFQIWLRDEYHHKTHTTINMQPIERYRMSIQKYPLNRTTSEQLDEFFLVSVYRNVRNDATVSYNGVIYEVPANYIGKRIELRYVQNDAAKLYLYDNDIRICVVKPVDVKANAQLHRPSAPNTVITFHNKRGDL